MPSDLVKLRKPLECIMCNIRFPDKIIMSHHKFMKNCAMNSPSIDINPHNNPDIHINVQALSILELKKMLLEKGERTSGNKSILCTRLENILAYENM